MVAIAWPRPELKSGRVQWKKNWHNEKMITRQIQLDFERERSHSSQNACSHSVPTKETVK